MSQKSKIGRYKCRFCISVPDRTQCSFRQVTYSRCDNVDKSWATLWEKAEVTNLHIHDIRRYFNYEVLQKKHRLTPEEAGWYIGNSKEVNIEHYTHITKESLIMRMRQNNFAQVLVSNRQSGVHMADIRHSHVKLPSVRRQSLSNSMKS